jgi:hypothetical protein
MVNPVIILVQTQAGRAHAFLSVIEIVLPAHDDKVLQGSGVADVPVMAILTMARC